MMVSDLIEQLQKPLKGYPAGCEQSVLWRKAADEIERLTDDVRLLLDALEQIAGTGCVTDESPELKMREIARKAIAEVSDEL